MSRYRFAQTALALLTAMGLSSLALGVETPPYESQEMKALGLALDKPLLIPALKDVTMAPFSIEMDGRIGVKVTGTTPSLDWTDPHLLSIDTAETSADKYLDLAFLIVPPNGETGFGDDPHTAERVFAKAEQGATTGVRIWAENGCIEIAWGGDATATVKPFDDCVRDAGLVPIP